MAERRIALYCCESSGYLAFEAITDPVLRAAVEVLRLPCSGSVEVGQILQAVERGYAGVLVLGCPLDNCDHLRGSRRAAARVEIARKVLAAAGLDPELVRMRFVSSLDAHKVAEAIAGMTGRSTT